MKEKLAGRQLRYLVGNAGIHEYPGDVVAARWGTMSIKCTPVVILSFGKRPEFFLEQAWSAGFRIVLWGLDRGTSWSIARSLQQMSSDAKLQVIVKNPLQWPPELASQLVEDPNVVGCVVERDFGGPILMNELRCSVNRPHLPVWFVTWNDPNAKLSNAVWARGIASLADRYPCMGVTISMEGKYTDSKDILKPRYPK